MSLAEYRTSVAVDVSLVDPLATRLLGLLEHFQGRVLIAAGRRDTAKQRELYGAWIAGIGNYAARPGTSLHESGRAADLRLTGVGWPEVHAEAARRGISFPLANHPDPAKREPWHCVAAGDWNPPPPEEPMTPFVHLPERRPGTPDTWDFTFLPRNGSTLGDKTCASWLVLRTNAFGPEDSQLPKDVEVWFDGVRQIVRLVDRRTVALPVTRDGLCSIVGPAVVAECREIWA